MIKELKPCPFCGADYHSLYFVMTGEYLDRKIHAETVGIFCNICKQTVTLEENEIEGDTEETRARAIKAWNRRVSNDDQGAI